MRRQEIWVFLVVMVTAAVGEICKPVDRLQAVNQSYKIDQTHAMYGLLGACPPHGEQLDDQLIYQIIDEGSAPAGITLMDTTKGVFRYEPGPMFTGVVSFSYRVSDSRGRTSLPAKVTIHVRGNPDLPLLETRTITAVEGTYVPIGMGVTREEDGRDEGMLTVTLCNCDEALSCDWMAVKCECLLDLPDGWTLADGLQHRLLYEDLTNLSTDQLQNLTLKTQVNSHGQHCLDVHTVNWHGGTDEPITIKHQLHITINPPTTIPVPGGESLSSSDALLQLQTREGRAIRFAGLRVRDSDAVKGTYRVKVSLDQGGTLWVEQDKRSDVVFFPKEEHDPDWDMSDDIKEYRRLDKYGDFYETYDMHDTQSSNNGKRNLTFVGSLEGINDVLSSMVYVPWCPHWPTPPNWNLPESSWMEPTNEDKLMSNDRLKPSVWPQWYPRFWYPFPRKHWSWWPRVLPPWWLNRTCSDWTSRVHVEMTEITPKTCDTQEETDVVHWDADVHVAARGSEPKSLIADNLFNYFPSTSNSVILKNLSIRSKEAKFRLRFSLNVVEDQVATIYDTDTNKPSFTCTTVLECNDKLQKIQVHLMEGVDACKVTIEIRMYKDYSGRLSDYMMLWAYKATSECINYLYYDPKAVIEPPQEPVIVPQGETVQLDLRYTSSSPQRTGILHTVIYADHGLVTVSVPDGLRVYMDHMGQHDRVPTYLCISGPTDMVLEALQSAKFTPLKNFKGQTTVKIDYTVPFTALKETYDTDLRPPKRRVIVNIRVVNGQRPYLPLLEMPSSVCMSEKDLLPLDMLRIQGRYPEDERVTLSLMALKGHLIVEPSRISEIYECPEQSDVTVDTQTVCTEECSFHTACPFDQLCCYQGCNRICTEPEKVAMIESHTNQNVIVHGKISTINRVLEAENMWYLAKPCQTDDMGQVVTDRVIETQEDAIRIEIVPARNPEGESVFGTLFIKVSCAPSPVSAEEVEEGGSPECQEVWSDWLDCQLLEGTCGQGTQTRRGQCGMKLLSQERPCMICGCQPVEEMLVDPSPVMMGCTSDLPIMRCPLGCEVETHHLQTHTFSCAVDPEEQDTEHPIPEGEVEPQPAQAMATKTKIVEVHDTCICSACLTHG